MKSPEIRKSFLDYFEERNHQPVPSAPLIPHGDPTLLFTNAGMVQFKNYFLGLETPPNRRAVSSQKCLRVSGKHNDLENVGPSPRHHTFFEMLGNFSFGDYFKEDAIRFGWDLVTRVWGLPKAQLFATVFEEDDEACELWAKLSDLPRERILRCGAKDNFWAMGETGPCGPCSEIFVDLDPELPAVDWDEGSENGRYLEIWNLVFMQYDRDPSGKLTPLPNPSIDTGSGLERVAAVLQGVRSNYDTDLFVPILEAAGVLAGVRPGEDVGKDVSLRVIADHLRAISFLSADGVIPGNEGRGYVLRRILRRAVRHGMRLGLEEPFLHRLVPVVGEVLDDAYPELAGTRAATVATVLGEEEKFLSTLATGARQLQEEIENARGRGEAALAGGRVFQLYDTFGMPIEVIREIAEEERISVDEEGFRTELALQQDRSRQARGGGQDLLAAVQEALMGGQEFETTTFEGYDSLELGSSKVLRLATASEEGTVLSATSLAVGDSGAALLDRTSCYAEGGGQVGDVGEVVWEGGRARLTDTQKNTTGVIFHFLEILAGTLSVGSEVTLRVAGERRRAIQQNHTATHLLHAALREVLGETVRQAGSLVAPDRLRFDFTYARPLTAEQRKEIEDRANAWVRKAAPVEIRTQGYQEAVAAGAMALFGEKYGDTVRTVEVPGFSLELCGGCHVGNTGEIGLLLVTGERGIASGVRRIEAVSGEGALQRVRHLQELLDAVEEASGVAAERAPAEISSLKNRVKAGEKELAALRLQMIAGGEGQGGSGEGEDVAGVRAIFREVPMAPPGELRNMADTLRSKLGSGVVVLGAGEDGKVSLVAAASKDLLGRVHAGNLVKAAARAVGGGGGGRPDFAQAGGKNPEKLPDALTAAREALQGQLGG